MKIKISVALFLLSLIFLQVWGGGSSQASLTDYPADVVGSAQGSHQ